MAENPATNPLTVPTQQPTPPPPGRYEVLVDLWGSRTPHAYRKGDVLEDLPDDFPYDVPWACDNGILKALDEATPQSRAQSQLRAGTVETDPQNPTPDPARYEPPEDDDAGEKDPKEAPKTPSKTPPGTTAKAPTN